MKINRIGETNISNQGYEMKIVEYKNNKDVFVEFQDEYKAKTHTDYRHFKNGNVKNPYHKNVFEVACIGEGKYKTRENGKITKAYGYWHNMIERCYEPYYLNEHSTYRDCTVCEDWLCFQNFAKWFYKHYYEISNERMNLDKDILCKGNKVYSPENCCIIPQRINSLFTKSNAVRGKYPIGVSWHKANNKFMAYCSFLNENGKKKTKNLGYYNTVEEAFLVYKQFKESYIKEVADEYKELISKELYKALYKYEVEMND